MLPLQSLLDLDDALGRCQPADFQKLADLLTRRARILDSLAAIPPAAITPALVAALEHTAQAGEAVRRNLLGTQHALTQELAALNQRHSYAGAICAQAPLSTTGLDCKG